MSDLAIPENRPALAWVMDIPADWVTPTERLVLLALALDSYNGDTCAPGRDGIMRLAGIKYVSSFTRARDALTLPTEYRPALLAVDALKGRHTRYQLLRDVREMRTGDVRESQTTHAEMSARDVRESRTGSPDAEMSAEVVRESCPPKLSARVVRESQTYPPSLPTPREGEREGEALAAPPPDGGALTRPTVAEVRATVEAVVPAAAIGAGIKCDNTDLADALATATGNGWTVEMLRAALSDMGRPKSSPTGQLLSRLKALGDPAALILPPTVSEATATPADPLAEANQTAVAKFCKWSGADREVLSKALADIVAEGYTVDASMYVDNYCQVSVYHPDLGDCWQVYWEAFQGVDFGEHVRHNEIRATFDGLPVTEPDRLALMSLDGEVETGAAWDLTVLAHRPSVGVLRRFVEVTGPIALACHEPASQAPPKPAKPITGTYTPPPVSEVLVGPEPPDQYRPGMSAPRPGHRRGYRPPGHDQAVRQADDAERQRQQDALAQLTHHPEEDTA